MLKESQGYKNIFQLGKPTESVAREDRNSLSDSPGNTGTPASGERTGTTDLNGFWCQISVPQILLMSIMVTEPSMIGILVPLVNTFSHYVAGLFVFILVVLLVTL